MILRKLRWLAAVALALAAPAVSHAGIVILVQESGGPEQIFSGSVSNYSTANFTDLDRFLKMLQRFILVLEKRVDAPDRFVRARHHCLISFRR